MASTDSGDASDTKRCIHCRKLKLPREFPRNKNRGDGHDSRCKMCTAKVVAERVARRPLVTEPQVAHKVHIHTLHESFTMCTLINAPFPSQSSNCRAGRQSYPSPWGPAVKAV